MKILVADDHALIRAGLSPLLTQLADGVRIVEAADLEQTRAALAVHPDIELALLDLQMPGMAGASSIAALRRAHPGLPLVVLSAEQSRGVIEAMLRAGAAGYVPKSASAEVMLGALRLVMAGGQYLPPLLLADGVPWAAPPAASWPAAPSAGVLSWPPTRAPSAPSAGAVPPAAAVPRVEPPALSARQREVVALLAEGLSNKMIARRLGLVEGTVKSHLVHIFGVLGVRNRTAAVVAAQALRTDPFAPPPRRP